MDMLTNLLDDFQKDESMLPAVRMAARRGRKMMDKYYGKTDESIMFRIGMSQFIVYFSSLHML